MPYEITVSKESVQHLKGDEFRILINVDITDGGDVVLKKVYSKRYTQGQTLDSVKSVLLKKIQADWDKLTAEQAIYNRESFGTLCSEIKNTIDGYVNS